MRLYLRDNSELFVILRMFGCKENKTKLRNMQYLDLYSAILSNFFRVTDGHVHYFICSTVLSFKRDQSHVCTSKGFLNNFQCLRRDLVSSYRGWKRLTHQHSPGQRSGKITRTLVWEAGRSWRWCKSSEEGEKKKIRVSPSM